MSARSMSIWTYSDSQDKTATEQAVRSRTHSCRFCEVAMSCSHHWVDTSHLPEHFRTERYVHYCPVCGWWMVREDAHGRDAAGAYAFSNIYGVIGSLKELALLDASHPLDDIRQYLAVRYERRKEVNPTVFEQVVACWKTAMTSARCRSSSVTAMCRRP